MNDDLLTYLNTKCRDFAGSPLITDSAGRTVTYRSFHDRVRSAANLMRPIGPDTRFSIALPNCAEFLYLLFGGIARGGIAVNLNPQMTADEFRYRLENAGVKVLYSTAEVIDRIAPVLKGLGVEAVVVCGGIDELSCLPAAPSGNAVIDFREAPTKPGSEPDLPASESASIAFFQYTGGTTGKMKAAMISHGNVLASVDQMGTYLSARLRCGEETFLVTFPFYHVFSIVFQVLMAMRFGSRIVLYPYVRDLPLLSRLMQEIPFTVFVGVHTIYKWLLQDKVLSSLKYPAAKIFIAGAEHIQPETKLRWKEATGHLIIEGYGLTETSALVSMSRLNPDENDIDGIGMPLPDTEMKLYSPESRFVDGFDEAGEIWVRGPQVVGGYYNNPEDNAATFVDGWLRTGDMAIRKPNGHFKIIGRKKEMINVSGFNVYPSEVESVLLQIPGVVECAVAGVPDARSGERVGAFLVTDRILNESDVIAYCREHLSAYKVPVLVRFPETLPKSAVGKVLRRELPAMA